MRILGYWSETNCTAVPFGLGELCPAFWRKGPVHPWCWDAVALLAIAELWTFELQASASLTGLRQFVGTHEV